jgi:hypothetical protein
VEFVLLLPILLLLVAAAIDGGRLMIAKQAQDRATGNVADWAAAHPGDSSWNSIAAQLFAPDCTVTVDDTGRPGIVTAGSRCTFTALALPGTPLDGINVSSEATAIVRDVGPTPTPSPS